MSDKIRIAIFISGRGSNMEAIIRACNRLHYPAEVVVVVSDRHAPGLDIAAEMGIQVRVLDHSSRETFADFADTVCLANYVNLIVLAGYMRILDATFTETWKIVNIHPSLLPAFPGLHPHRQALAAGVEMSGCTVHWVVPEVDTGPIITQAAVAVLPGDTEETLAARILEQEHRLYPMTIKMIALQMLAERQ